MIPYERRKQILQKLESQEVVSLEDFGEVLPGVSKSTLRRDLKTLADEGQIILLRGGGVRLKQGSFETPVNSKSIQHVNEKERIALCAARLVKDGEVIYLDSGSTALRMVKHLRGKQITIVTTNALIFPELQETNINCILIGGEINIATASIVGTTTNSTLMRTYFDKAFIGASGFSAQAGINTVEMKEAEKKQIVRANSREAYVLADSSKDGKTTMCKVFDLGEVPIIIDKKSPLLVDPGSYLLAP